MYFIYIIQNTYSKQIYIGVTNDLKRRLAEHNSGGTKATKRNNGLWKVVYAEIYGSKIDAYARENKLKQHGRAKQELLKRITNSLII